jgi:hypothetical protein
MAIPLTSDAIGDLVASTLKDLGRFKWTNIMSTLQKFTFLNEMLKANKVGFDSGYALQWNVAVTRGTNARMVGLGAVDVVNINDGMVQGTAPWRYMVGAWGFERREILQNKNNYTRIFELIKFRRAQSMQDVAELMEAQGWQLPGGTSDTLNLFGIPYWIVPNATEGFNGLNPYGYTAGAGGIDSTTYPNWSNYTAQFADYSKPDLIRKMRRALEWTQFESPDIVEEAEYSTGDKRGIYTTWQGRERLEEIAEQQNDNLGRDVTAMAGKVRVHGIAVNWVPKLEQLTGTGTFSNANYTSTGALPVGVQPYYGINWSDFKPVFMSGDYMRESGPKEAPNQHNLMRTFIDFSLNTICHNRRSNWILTL